MKIVAWNGEEIMPMLTARNAGGSQRMPDKANCGLVIEIDDESDN